MSDLFYLSGSDTVLWLHPEPHCNTQYIHLKCLFIFLIETCRPTILFLKSVAGICCYLALFIFLVGSSVTVTTARTTLYAFCFEKHAHICLLVCVWMHVYIYFLLVSRQYKEWKSYTTSSQLPVMNTEYKIKFKPCMLEDSIRNNSTFIEQQTVIKRIKPWLSC